MKKTLVLGASTKPERYANMATHRLLRAGHEVVLIGNNRGSIAGIDILHSTEGISDIDTVTMYLSEKNQEPYYTFLMELKPKRIIFNPGTENENLQKLAHSSGIETIEACTLVMLATGEY